VRRQGLARRLLEAFAAIDRALDARLGPTGIPLPSPDDAETTPLAHLKRYEDALDALVCAWVGSRFLAGEAMAFGDADSAIWAPERAEAATTVTAR